MASKPLAVRSRAARAKSPVMRSRSAPVADRINFMVTGLSRREAERAGARLERALATGPAWPIWALAAAPSAWTASVSLPSPAAASGLTQMHWAWVRPSGATARYATVVMPAPPAATLRWYSTSSGVASASGVTPSKVAALMIRLRRVTGPSRAGAKGSTMV